MRSSEHNLLLGACYKFSNDDWMLGVDFRSQWQERF